MEWHACHLDRRACRIAALGQGDVEKLCGLDGIIKKQLVKIAHAVEHQGVGVLRLDGEILRHHRSMGGDRPVFLHSLRIHAG